MNFQSSKEIGIGEIHLDALDQLAMKKSLVLVWFGVGLCSSQRYGGIMPCNSSAHKLPYSTRVNQIKYGENAFVSLSGLLQHLLH